MHFSEPYWLLFALPVALLFFLFRSPRRSLNLWRGGVVLLILLALADFSIRLPRPGGVVVVVADRSASLPSNFEAEQREVIDALQQEVGPNQKLAIVSVAEVAAVEHTQGQGLFGGFAFDVGADQSRLSDGLDLALSLIPPDTPGRILMLSDGHWSGRDPLGSAQECALRGIPIDFRLQQRPWLPNDLAIHSISAPQMVAEQESFLLHAWVNSPFEQRCAYELKRDDKTISKGERAFKKGLNRIVFRDQLTRAGSAEYALVMEPSSDDPLLQNNRARCVVGVGGDLSILCISHTPNSAIETLLGGAGMSVTAVNPEAMEWTLSNLSRFSCVILENISASEIGSSQMELLAAWVETSGRGLWLTGGERSYGAGGYFNSPLDSILPVSMELRREHRKLALAMAVVLDRSGSMGAPVAGGKTKMDLANIGTVQVLDLLSDMDEMGVLAVDSQPHVILRLKPLAECRARRNDILQIESRGGGIYVYEGLVDASKMLLGASAGTRHIILFADANDAEQPGKYKQLLEQNRMANITVSVVALGGEKDIDAEFLRDVAARGGGEIYFTEDAMEIPRIFAQDTFAVARSTFQENETTFRWTPLMSLLSGGHQFSAPSPLGGYNLCYLREGAQLLAVSEDEYEAPIAAGWQAGAGRVLCYTGEIDGAFTGQIANWPEYGAFLAGMARWTAGDKLTLPKEALLTQEVKNGACYLSLHLDPNRKESLFSAVPTVKVLRVKSSQSLKKETFKMSWKSADLLELVLPLNGDETIASAVTVGDFSPVVMPPACLVYSPEYASKKPQDGVAALENLAAIGGGRERLNVRDIWKELPTSWKRVSLQPWLFLAALVLFVFEIIERRVGLRRGQTAARPQRTARKVPRQTTKPVEKVRGVKPAEVKPEAGTESALKGARSRAQHRFKR